MTRSREIFVADGAPVVLHGLAIVGVKIAASGEVETALMTDPVIVRCVLVFV